MPVYLVEWETSGSIPVEANSPEEAAKLARRDWANAIRDYSEYDADFCAPKEVRTLADVYRIDSTFADVDGDCCVVNSKKALNELLERL